MQFGIVFVAFRGRFRCNLGSFSVQFWGVFGTNSGRFRCKFRSFSAQFQVVFGAISGRFRRNFRSFSAQFEAVQGRAWWRSVCYLASHQLSLNPWHLRTCKKTCIFAAFGNSPNSELHQLLRPSRPARIFFISEISKPVFLQCFGAVENFEIHTVELEPPSC